MSSSKKSLCTEDSGSWGETDTTWVCMMLRAVSAMCEPPRWDGCTPRASPTAWPGTGLAPPPREGDMASASALEAREIAALSEPRAFPRDPSSAGGVEHVQTHLSHVFLTGERVYKFRKAVDLGFVRFTSRAERNADCLREVALNRRLSPDVYLGVAPLLASAAEVRVGPAGEGLAGDAEHCVVMRRLP